MNLFIPRDGFRGIVWRHRAVVLAQLVRELDLRRGTESRTGGVGPIKLAGRDWNALLSLANGIDPAAQDDVPF